MNIQQVDARGWRPLTDPEWDRVRELIPAPKRQGKRKVITDRELVDNILYREYTGLSWSRLPVPEEAYLAMVKRYSRWKKTGTLEDILQELEDMGLLPVPIPPAGTPLSPPARPPEWWELTDGQWARISSLLPPDQEDSLRSSRYKTNRQILNAILYREYTGLPWREMPREFGSWRTVYSRYIRWKEDGIFDPLFAALREEGILAEDKYLQMQPSRIGYEEERDWWEVTGEQWRRLADLFPPEEFNKRGKKAKSSRTMLDAILCRARCQIPWNQLPEKYGSRRTVIERYRKWRDDGTLEQIFRRLEQPYPIPEPEALLLPTEAEDQVRFWWELTDGEWGQVADLFLSRPDQPQRGKPRTNRMILDVLLYREYTNTPWAQLPGEKVSWRTVYDRYVRWRKDGTLEQVFSRLKELGVLSEEKYRMGRGPETAEDSLDWWEVTDEQWEVLQHFFPPRSREGSGRRAHSDRQMLNAILCRYHTGTPWLELPRKYGSWRVVMERYRLWREDGTLERVFETIDNKTVMRL